MRAKKTQKRGRKKVESGRELTVNYLGRSVQLAQAGHLAEAVEETRNQISKHPRQTYLNFWLGILLYDIREYEAARDAFKRELEITPRFRDAAWELGSVCSRLGRTEESIKAYYYALDIDPCCVQALFGLGNANLRDGNYPEAIEYYKDTLLLLPELDRSDLRASKDSSRSSVVEVYYNLGIAWIRVNQPVYATEAFEMVRKLGQGGQLAEFASQYLELLSNPNIKLDSIQWSSTELRPEDQ